MKLTLGMTEKEQDLFKFTVENYIKNELIDEEQLYQFIFDLGINEVKKMVLIQGGLYGSPKIHAEIEKLVVQTILAPVRLHFISSIRH